MAAPLRLFPYFSAALRPLHTLDFRRNRTTWILAALFGSSWSSGQAELSPSFLPTTTFRHPRGRYCGSTTIPAMAILDSPSAERNKEPIWKVLSENVLPILRNDAAPNPTAHYTVLEVAAGAGVHTHYLTSKLLDWGRVRWMPSDPDELARTSISERTRLERNSQKVRVDPPLPLTLVCDGILQDDAHHKIPSDSLDLIICINMIHISPWEATVGLMKMASAKLRKGGVLYCYGPYKRDGTSADTNLAFDQSLRMRDPSWGVRDLEDVIDVARQNGVGFVETVTMPANNLSVIYRKE